MADKVVTAARRAADGRRVLLGSFESPDLRLRIALDLMSVPAREASPDNLRFADIIASTHAASLRSADFLLADPDMCALVDTAAQSMPDQVLRSDDPVVTPSGFLSFADPLPDRTGAGLPLPVHALSWVLLPAGHPLLAARDQTSESVLLTSYVSTFEMAAHLGRRVPIDSPRYLPNATVMWQVGTPIGLAYGEEVGYAGAQPGFYQRLAAAFWTLSKQPLAESSDGPSPSNKEARRFHRAGIARPAQPVRIVHLRRRLTSSPRGQGAGRQVSVRSLVRGYWKNAYRPSVGEHRLVFVAPHVRGPEGAPLLGGEKVLLVKGDQQATPESA